MYPSQVSLKDGNHRNFRLLRTCLNLEKRWLWGILLQTSIRDLQNQISGLVLAQITFQAHPEPLIRSPAITSRGYTCGGRLWTNALMQSITVLSRDTILMRDLMRIWYSILHIGIVSFVSRDTTTTMNRYSSGCEILGRDLTGWLMTTGMWVIFTLMRFTERISGVTYQMAHTRFLKALTRTIRHITHLETRHMMVMV